MKPENTLSVARAAIWMTREKQKILVAQRPPKEKTSNYPNRWEFPGGKVEEKEPPHLTAVRETKEETGLSVIRFFQPSDLSSEYLMTDPESAAAGSRYIDWLIKTWVIETVAFQPQTLTTHPIEHQEFRWVSLDEAQELNLTPQSDFALPYLRSQQNILRSLLGLDPLPPIKLG